jgi:hypothetical protein
MPGHCTVINVLSLRINLHAHSVRSKLCTLRCTHAVAIDQLSAAVQTGKPDEQLRALRTLAGMAKRGDNLQPAKTVQDAFRTIGGLPLLVKVINDSMVRSGCAPRSDWGEQQRCIPSGNAAWGCQRRSTPCICVRPRISASSAWICCRWVDPGAGV